MLLDFRVSNFLSFKKETALNMIPGKEQKFSRSLPLLKSRYGRKVNPVAAIFGANAAGKSNLVAALSALQRMVHNPAGNDSQLIYHPFLLDGQSDSEPTTMEVLFEIDDYIYEYVLEYDSEKVIEESLTLFLSRDEREIFSRRGGEIELGRAFQRLEGLALTVPDAVPLVSHIGNAKISTLGLSRTDLLHATAPFRWFYRVAIVDSQRRELGFFLTNVRSPWYEAIRAIDAGISGVEETPVQLDTLDLPDKAKEKIERAIHQEGHVEIEIPRGRFTLKKDDESAPMQAFKVELTHEGAQGKAYPLEWWDESDGTRMVAQLLTLFARLSKKDKRLVLVIDELDRSFHTELSRALIDGFLEQCDPQTRSQLIFTTHDLLLMDPSRFRKDQMWLVEKQSDGQSVISSISEFDGLRSDNDIRKMYLEGRLGAIPYIKPISFEETN